MTPTKIRTSPPSSSTSAVPRKGCDQELSPGRKARLSIQRRTPSGGVGIQQTLVDGSVAGVEEEIARLCVRCDESLLPPHRPRISSSLVGIDDGHGGREKAHRVRLVLRDGTRVEFNLPLNSLTAPTDSFLAVKGCQIDLAMDGGSVRVDVLDGAGERLMSFRVFAELALGSPDHPIRWVSKMDAVTRAQQWAPYQPDGSARASGGMPAADVGRLVQVALRALADADTARKGEAVEPEDVAAWQQRVGGQVAAALSERLSSDALVTRVGDELVVTLAAWSAELPAEVCGPRPVGASPEKVRFQVRIPVLPGVSPEQVARTAAELRKSLLGVHQSLNDQGDGYITYRQRIPGSVLRRLRLVLVEIDLEDLTVHPRLGGWDEPAEFGAYARRRAEAVHLDPMGDEFAAAARAVLSDAVANYPGEWADRAAFVKYARGLYDERFPSQGLQALRKSLPVDDIAHVVWARLEQQGLIQGDGRDLDIAPAAFGAEEFPGARQLDDLRARLRLALGLSCSWIPAPDAVAEAAVQEVADWVEAQVDVKAECLPELEQLAGLPLVQRFRALRARVLDEAKEEVDGLLASCYRKAALAQQIRDAICQRLIDDEGGDADGE